MLQLEYELKKMCREHRVDGRTTQSDRLELAATIARDLETSGYHRFSRQKSCSRKLKDKHVRGLVQHWTGKGLSPGTINNRLAFLRHVCEWTGRGGVMSKRNADYHEGKRVREATVSKAAYVGTEVLNRVRNRYAQASLRLQVAFGLRCKEALMIQPDWADRGNRIVLHDSWTKGGRPLSTARKIAVLFYNTMRYCMQYADPGVSHYDQRYRQRAVVNLRRRARALGFTLQEHPAGVS